MTVIAAPRASADEPEHPHVAVAPGILGWLTTTDHKKIGISYMVTAFGFFMLGGALAEIIRAQLFSPESRLVSPGTYNEIFTMHGSIMMYLFIVPFAIGLANYLVPLQIGAREMAFPRLNALGYWLYLFGGLTMVSGFLTADGAAAFGWTGYAPLSNDIRSPSVGGDLWLLAIVLTGLASVLAAVNIVATVSAMRAPGMSMFRMPIFTWNMLVTSVLVLIAFPVLTAASLMLLSDRHLDSHVFDPANGGEPILWQHLFWFFGHPEVYIAALPFFGIITEVLPVFSWRPIFGYKGIVAATLGIAALSVGVWAHHMFTTGAVEVAFFSGLSLPDRGAHGHQVLQLDRDDVAGPPHVPDPDAVRGRVPDPVPGRRADRRDPRLAPGRLPAPRLVLRRRPHALRAVRRLGVRAVRGHLLLVPEVHRQAAARGLGPRALRADVRRLQPDVPRAAQARASKACPAGSPATCPTTGSPRSTGCRRSARSSSARRRCPFLWNVWRTRKRGTPAGDNPWGGHTLEWATTSPPPPHNFDRLPRIRSNRPVWDMDHPDHPEQF